MQLELFTPTLLMFAMTTNLALLKRQNFTLYLEVKMIRERVWANVSRATFYAKINGIDFSEYPRR